MSLFHRKPDPAQTEAVDALFAANLSAHERAGQAADHVARSSDRTRNHLERLRREIAQRTDQESRARPSPPTSDVRSLVETALARVQPRSSQKG
jgi:hypothetical protein